MREKSKTAAILALVFLNLTVDADEPENRIRYHGEKSEPKQGGKTNLEILPRTDFLPANFLKFYLQFDAPMTRGSVFEHLSLEEIDEGGKKIHEVPEPFREVELWDETFTRLTVWLHPGRQKPGVNLNVELGPVLEPRKKYALIISPKWLDEKGEPIGGQLVKKFSTTPPRKHQLKPKIDWDIRTPFSDKPVIDEFGNPIVMNLPTQLDPIALRRHIKVEGNRGPLRIFVVPDKAGGSRLEISGSRGFRKGDYQLIFDPRLEDLAGNSIARPFNLDLEKQPDFKSREKPVVIEFSIK